MFLSLEIDIKLWQNYTKTYIYIYVRYTSVSRGQNSLQWQCSILVTLYRLRHVTTIILHCHWVEVLVTWYGRIPYIKIYIRFGISLSQFYINFSGQEHQIDVLYVLFNVWDSQVSSLYPLSFFLYSPFKYNLANHKCSYGVELKV